MKTASRNSLQDPFLNDLRKRRATVVVYLMNGIAQWGTLHSFDQHVIVLKQGSNMQLLYKSMVASIMQSRHPKPSLKPHDSERPEPREFRDNREARDSCESREFREPREPREPREIREPAAPRSPAEKSAPVIIRKVTRRVVRPETE